MQGGDAAHVGSDDDDDAGVDDHGNGLTSVSMTNVVMTRMVNLTAMKLVKTTMMVMMRTAMIESWPGLVLQNRQ